MKTTDKNQLMDQLAQYGYALMRPKPAESGEKLLANLLQQDDVRLLEGFPVVLASVLKEKEVLEWEHKNWRPSNVFSKKTEHRLLVMLTLSYLLFELFGMMEYCPRVLKLLARWAGAKVTGKLVQQFRTPFLKSENLQLDDDVELSTERLKNNFRNYGVHREEGDEVQKKRRVLELELLLSELFTPRQKELLKKRLEDKTFTKTEKEYFYRVVKKRLKALASEELHQMARSLVEK